MADLNIPQLSWIRGYLTKHYPNQPLAERADGPDTIIIDVNDSHGRPKELRITREFLQRFNKPTVEEYLQSAKIAEQIETVPFSVSITKAI